MIVKNKIVDKIIKGYYVIFFLFSILSVNIVIGNILNYYNIENVYIDFFIFLISITTYIYCPYVEDKWNDEVDKK